MKKEELLKTKREIVAHIEKQFIVALKQWRFSKSQIDHQRMEDYWELLRLMGHADYKKSALIMQSLK